MHQSTVQRVLNLYHSNVISDNPGQIIIHISGACGNIVGMWCEEYSIGSLYTAESAKALIEWGTSVDTSSSVTIAVKLEKHEG